MELEKHQCRMSQLGKWLLASYIMLAVIYVVASIHLLTTPIENWIFNFGQYNQQLLELFPKAQNWVNVSVAFREKVIPLHVLYQLIFWFIFLTVIIDIVKNWHWYQAHEPYCLSSKVRKRGWMVFYLFFTGFFIWASFFVNDGSDYYKLYEDLRVSLHGEYKMWSTTYGFILYRLLMLGGVGVFTKLFLRTIITIKYLFTAKQTEQISWACLMNNY